MRDFCIAAFLLATVTDHAAAQQVSEADILALARKHCVQCHDGTAQSMSAISLNGLDQLRKAAPLVAEQVANGMMPLGNQTGMTDNERATLVGWARTVAR